MLRPAQQSHLPPINSTMGIRIRKDIFTDRAITVNTDNLQENPLTTVQPMRAEKLKFVASKTRAEKRKKDSEEQDRILTLSGNTEKLMKTVKLVMGGKKPKLVVNTLEGIQRQSESNEKGKEAAKETEKDQCQIDTEVEKKNSNTIDDAEDWFDARKFIMQMNGDSNKRQKLNVPECSTAKVSSDVPINGKVGSTTSTTATEISKSLKFSNHTKDSVQTVCQLCQGHFYFVNMRNHTRKAHQLSISDYKAKYGALQDHIVEEIYHECGICSKAMLFDSDSMNHHTKKHGLTHKEYSAKYLTLVKPQHTKSSEPEQKSYTDLSAQELLEKLQDMIAQN